MIDEKGRCCGRKPIVYKRERKLFCCRCDRTYDIETKQQIDSFSWRNIGGKFVEICVICKQPKPCGKDHSVRS